MKGETQRLRDIRSALELAQKEFASRLNISASRLSNYLSGSRDIPFEVLTQLSSIFNVNLNWLITGEGEMFNRANLQQVMRQLEDAAQVQVELKRAESVRIPIVGSIAAGTPLEIMEVDPIEYITLDKSVTRFPKDYLCFRVDGDSMYPEIRNGDVVLICRHYDYDKLNRTICAVQLDGENTLKRVHVNIRKRQTILNPVNNKNHDPIILDEDNPENAIILGVMIMLFRKYM